ncbi:MAG: type II toxin-antitoxin system VapC family toxin [Acidobacteria bacterium]|nr:type II toxin-antitoxin system VapC family toxin [Acidobacteriota bacterium]
MNRVFVDTSAWYAYLNRSDPDHREAAAALETFSGRLVSSNFILDEIVTLCQARLGHGAAERVGAVLLDSGAVDLVRLTARDELAAWHLFVERPDKQYSFTDCTSFVLMRRLGLGSAIALDHHFRQEGFGVVPD